MAEHARIHADAVAELVELDPAVHAAWTAVGNPKAEAYRPVVNDTVPAFDPATHTVDPSLVIEPARVRRAWTVRPLTADEKRHTWPSYEFLRRFTAAERDSVRTAAASDSAVADLLMFLQTSTEVVSDDLTTAVGMAYLVHLGIITEARKAELLAP